MRDLITTPTMEHLVKSDLSQLHPPCIPALFIFTLIFGPLGVGENGKGEELCQE
jgi:hypothetical protein